MRAGKVSESILKRSVFKQIRHRREEVIVRPGVGIDCSAIQLGEDEVVVLSTDPITGTKSEIGKLAIQITANDIAAGGAELVGVMLSILLPLKTSEARLKTLIKELEAECAALNIEIAGGHTEVTAAVNQPVITVTGVGKIKRDQLDQLSGMKADQDIVMTKWAGLEGTAIIANDFEEELLTRYSKTFIDQAKEFISSISIQKEARIAKEFEVTAMHDITEGGVFGALWEMAASANVGVEIALKKIPLKQHTVELCEFYDLNPYLLISSGSLLLSTYRGSALVAELQKQGIEACVIGKVTKGHERIIINEDEVRYLEPPKSDELYKVADKRQRD
ncbi:thiamine-monophosphate kinase [Lachnospiraceae bacterium KM106-2]|nr:thiamine-monophosphate kinase [Lachnospiraceae bacterium KM106-2]